MIRLSVKATGAEVVRQGLQDLNAEIPRIGRKGIYDKMRGVLTRLRQPGAPSTSPVNWDSEKQRRFVLAKLSAEDNLPYRRTGHNPRAWELVPLPMGYRLENPQDAAVYIYGNFEGARQSKIHESRWPIMQELVEAAIEEMPSEIEQNISYYGRQKGF